LATGEQTVAFAQNSTALGSFTLAYAANSTALGNMTEASGIQSTAMGDSTTSSGESSTAMGNATTSAGSASVAMGNNTIANGFGSLVVGNYNNTIVANPETSIQPTTPLFIVGNGNATVRNNAMVVRNDGNTGLGTNTPLTKLHVKGAIAFDSSAINIFIDNQYISVGNRGYLKLSSDSPTASSRTIVLSDGLAVGQLLIIECISPANAIEVADNTVTNNTNMQSSRVLQQNDVVQLIWNGVDWLEMYYANN